MACGLPVIAADAHGPAQIVAPGTGWLVPADDQRALTEALLEAASDGDERRRRGERARQRSAHYGWPVVADRIARIYGEVAEASTPGGRPGAEPRLARPEEGVHRRVTGR
jgi:phosphatidylinositol alpha 1,6-mannosyltransferase